MDLLKEIQSLELQIQQQSTSDPEMDKIRGKIESKPEIKDLIRESLAHQIKLKQKSNQSTVKA